MERSEQKQERIALFPGSFDPFTIGHQSLVKRGLALADRIIIAIGINENKQSCFPLEERLEAIRSLFQDDPRIEVITYHTLTTDLAEKQEPSLSCGAFVLSLTLNMKRQLLTLIGR